MKKYCKQLLVAFLLTITMSLASGETFYAVEDIVVYDIDELSMTIQIPNEIKVINRGVKQNDPLFQDGTFDYIQTMSDLRENDVYLLGKNFDKSYVLEVIMTNDNESAGYSDYKMLSSKAQEELLKSISSKENTIACSIYNTDSARYIESLSKNYVEGKACFSKEYYTLVNGKNILVRINSFDDQLSEDEMAQLKTIVDSIVFANSSNWSFASSFIGTTVCAIILIMGFTIIAVIKIKDIPISKKVHTVLNKIKSNLKTPENNDEETESQMIIDFLSTDKELEDKESQEFATTSLEQLNKTENDEVRFTDSIDISVDGLSTEIDEDEEINVLTESDFEFLDEKVDKNVGKSVMYSNDNSVNPDSEKFSLKETVSEIVNTTSTENTNNKRDSNNSESESPSAFVKENNNNSANNDDNFSEIDLAAAIANFEDDAERRRIRREEFRNKNKENNKSTIWSKTKSK